jgi:hypothetical protein
MTLCTRSTTKVSGILFAISSTSGDLGEILDEDEVKRIKTAPIIPPMLQFEPQIPGEIESEEAKRARTRGQSLADKLLMQGEKHSISNQVASSEIQSTSNCASAQEY